MSTISTGIPQLAEDNEVVVGCLTKADTRDGASLPYVRNDSTKMTLPSKLAFKFAARILALSVLHWKYWGGAVGGSSPSLPIITVLGLPLQRQQSLRSGCKQLGP